jgi:thioesterase domain-containing protein
MVYFIDKTNSPTRRSRRHDFEVLAKEAKSSDPATRESARRSMEAIRKEDHKIASMRESLIKAHRNQDHNEIKDIHDYVSKRKKYQND